MGCWEPGNSRASQAWACIKRSDCKSWKKINNFLKNSCFVIFFSVLGKHRRCQTAADCKYPKLGFFCTIATQADHGKELIITGNYLSGHFLICWTQAHVAYGKGRKEAREFWNCQAHHLELFSLGISSHLSWPLCSSPYPHSLWQEWEKPFLIQGSKCAGISLPCFFPSSV